MPVPDYQTLMRPILASYEDGADRSIADVRAALADAYELTPTERVEKLPSGTGRKFDNRVGWAVTYLFRAGCLQRSKRSVYRITERGLAVLGEHPDTIDNAVLANFNEFNEFRNVKSSSGSGTGVTVAVPLTTAPPTLDVTPEEQIDAAFAQLNNALAAELIDRVMERDPDFFERLVVEVLSRMGYGKGQHLGGTGDGGFDGVIDADRLGLDRIFVQAKRWAGPVGRPALQAFVGALAGPAASKGVFITTSTFTSGAIEFANAIQSRVVLVDGKDLARLMIEHEVGVSVARRYEVKRLDLDYFSDASLVGESQIPESLSDGVAASGLSDPSSA